jgi:hypothetical protein
MRQPDNLGSNLSGAKFALLKAAVNRAGNDKPAGRTGGGCGVKLSWNGLLLA